MYLSIENEAQFFLFCIFAGIASAFFYDILRISRRIVKVSDAVVNAGDIFFFVTAAILMVLAAYLKNSGELRLHSFLGFGLGTVLYIVIVKNRLLNAGTILVSFIVKLIGTTLRIILFPIKLIMKIFQKPISIIAWYTGHGLKRVKSKAKSRSIKLRLTIKNLKCMLKKS